MDEALEAAEFLARSENRVAALFELREGPLTRSELVTATGMSQVTLGRVLSDLEDRRWIEAVDGTYRITPLGSMVADSVESFLDALDAAETLQDFAHHLPTEEYDFPLERLTNGSLFVPDPSNPNATMRAAASQVAHADDVRILTHGFSTLVMDAMYEGVMAGEMVVESVYSSAVYEAMAAAEGVDEELRALLDADDATFYRYDGEVPHVLAILDDSLGIGVDDEQGRPIATFDVEDPVVREWAIGTFERYRAESTVVDDFDDVLSTTRAD